jgi:hypothetical protein
VDEIFKRQYVGSGDGEIAEEGTLLCRLEAGATKSNLGNDEEAQTSHVSDEADD